MDRQSDQEVELKLALPAGALRKAERLPWLRKLATAPLAHQPVTSVYFDTKKGKLRRNGISLRVRRLGAKHLQTIKGTDGAGALARFEREHEIASPRPRLKYAKGTPLAPLADKKLKKKLRPIFRTTVRRGVMNVRLHDSNIELAFDRGKVATRSGAQPLHELELELKRGRAEDVAALARRLQKDLPIGFGARAKAERGYALAAGRPDEPARAAPIVLAPGQSAGAAFTAIGLSCLRHLAANEQAVLAGDPDGVHQMRVGLRRLRAAISLLGDMVRDSEVEDLERELKWLTSALAPARDLDVLAREAIAPLRQQNPDTGEIALLEQDVCRRRRAELVRVRQAVAGARFRAITLTTALWLIDGPWRHDGRSEAAERRAAAIEEVAAEILQRRARKVIKRTKRLETLDARRRHKLRIAVKKLRYGCDFFESLFGHRKAQRRYGKALKELQGCLGKLNDLRVHREAAHRLTARRKADPRRPQKAYAMGLLAGREQDQAPGFISAARKAGRRLAHATAFW